MDVRRNSGLKSIIRNQAPDPWMTLSFSRPPPEHNVTSYPDDVSGPESIPTHSQGRTASQWPHMTTHAVQVNVRRVVGYECEGMSRAALDSAWWPPGLLQYQDPPGQWCQALRQDQAQEGFYAPANDDELPSSRNNATSLQMWGRNIAANCT